MTKEPVKKEEAVTKTTVAPAPSAPFHSEAISHGRIPLIKFKGKRSHIKSDVLHPVITPVPAIKASPVPKPTAKAIKEGNGVDFSTLKGGAMFGRPLFSQKEIDAIESGGATDF